MSAIITAKAKYAEWETTWQSFQIVKDGKTMELNHDEVVKMLATIKGERLRVDSPELDGWCPKWTILHSELK